MLDPERDYTDSDLAALEAAERERLASFTLGEPALVCRWRLADRALPLKNRHLRALAARAVRARPLTPEFLAWVRQHLEQTLTGGAAEHPDGVLMLVQDADGHAVMSVGEYCALEDRRAEALAARARASLQEAAQTGVAPETLWEGSDQGLVAGLEPGSDPSGAATLVLDLASTLGIPVRFSPQLAEKPLDGPEAAEVFLVSDEHGVVPAVDRPGPLGERLSAAYETLRARTQRRR